MKQLRFDALPDHEAWPTILLARRLLVGWREEIVSPQRTSFLSPDRRSRIIIAENMTESDTWEACLVALREQVWRNQENI